MWVIELHSELSSHSETALRSFHCMLSRIRWQQKSMGSRSSKGMECSSFSVCPGSSSLRMKPNGSGEILSDIFSSRFSANQCSTFSALRIRLIAARVLSLAPIQRESFWDGMVRSSDPVTRTNELQTSGSMFCSKYSIVCSPPLKDMKIVWGLRLRLDSQADTAACLCHSEAPNHSVLLSHLASPAGSPFLLGTALYCGV